METLIVIGAVGLLVLLSVCIVAGVVHSVVTRKQSFEERKFDTDMTRLQREDRKRRDEIDAEIGEINSLLRIARDDIAYMSKTLADAKEDINTLKVSQGWKSDERE